MFASALVPLDGSPLATKILPHARHILAPGAELSLLTVLEGASVQSANVLRQLGTLRDGLAGSGLVVQTVVRDGAPAAAILDAAAKPPQGVIAMSTHGRSGLERLTRGSVAEAVLRQATAPMLLANPRALERAPSGPPRRILVALDGGPGTAEVLELVRTVARGAGSDARVTLLTVEAMPITEVPMPMAVPPWDPAEARGILLRARDELAGSGLQVTATAAFGFEAASITRATAEADLVVMGTSGRSGLLRLVQGSVAEEVLRHAACPVLVRRFVEE